MTTRRTAVCITGHCDCLNLTHENLLENVFARLGEHDVFMSIVDDRHAESSRLLRPVAVSMPEPNIDELVDVAEIARAYAPPGPRRYRRYIHNWIHQIFKYRDVNRLRVAHEQEHGIRYDCVVRLRTDLLFQQPIPLVEDLDLRSVWVTSQHGWGGIADTFAVSSADNMDVYLGMLDEVEDAAHLGHFVAAGESFNPEKMLEHHLTLHGIEIAKSDDLQHDIVRRSPWGQLAPWTSAGTRRHVLSPTVEAAVRLVSPAFLLARGASSMLRRLVKRVKQR